MIRIPVSALTLSLLTQALASEGFFKDPDTGITLPHGFDAEILCEVPDSQGSWVSMAFDPKGRLIVSDQDDKGVFRVTLPDNPGTQTKVESLTGFPYEPIDWGKRKVGGALGFHYAFDSLYMVTMKGLFRIRDTDGDDQYDEFKLLRRLNYGFEHSAHSIITTEDGTGLYLVSGNYTRTPEGTTSLEPAVWKEDSLLPSLPDPMGHAVGIPAPGGWICRISPDGSEWNMIAAGLRNPVDIALNPEGELFTYDSDLEFDIGCPWYRPTRVNHVTSGAEFGWRSSSAKWQEYFADSLGAVINVGPGSPTGISFGHHSHFPASFRDKLFICDWTFGTIYTVTLEENGSSYSGTKEEFLHGTPLNIAAMRFGPDGAMYFLTGGRGTASKLYRVRHVGTKSGGEVRRLVANQPLRDLRRSLEKYHDGGASEEKAVVRAWPYLGHEDRPIRYAARIAIENQPISLWQERAFTEADTRSAVYAMMAVCRMGEPSLKARVIRKLGELPFGRMRHEDQLALLRAYSLCFLRLGKPDADEAAAIIAKIDPFYPAKDDTLNAELCRVLAYLDSPTVAKKTVELMRNTRSESADYDQEMLGRHEYGLAILKMMANTPNTRNIHYAYCLRGVRSGWSEEDLRFFFGWLNESLTKEGGRSFSGYIRLIRADAIARLDPAIASTIPELLREIGPVDLDSLPLPQGPPGTWTVETAMKLFETDLTGRSYENGKKMFAAGRCVACHRFEGSGGVSGPDLGSVGNRFSIRDIIIAICEPSASISEQYLASQVTLKNGGSLYGRLLYRNDKEIAVAANPFNYSETAKAPADQVEKIEYSQVSMMPPGMIAAMNAEEVKDLIAYLLSGGDKGHRVFRQK